MPFYQPVMLLLALFTSAIACLYLFWPQHRQWLQSLLNRPWGQKTVLALRCGIPGEEQAESILNREIHGREITWDRWAERHPVFTGIGLLVLATCLWVSLFV